MSADEYVYIVLELYTNGSTNARYVFYSQEEADESIDTLTKVDPNKEFVILRKKVYNM